MRIDVKGRNLPVSDEIREHVNKRFRKVERQVSELAELEVEVLRGAQPGDRRFEIAEATLHLKGVDAPRERRLARHRALDQPRQRRARAAGEAQS